MNTYGGIEPATVRAPRTVTPGFAPHVRRKAAARASDTVDLRSLIPPPADQGRIAEIRRQIADGTYLTDDKLDVVVGRLHSLLVSERGARPEVA